MKLSIDQWAELWFRHNVHQGMHAGVALMLLETFRRSLETPAPQGPLPRIVTQTERYIIVELALEREGTTQAIFCRRCCSTSFNPNDVQQLFCGRCDQFHS